MTACVRDDKKVLVLGLGNVFCGDDGIGSLVAESLSKKVQEKNVDIVDGGTIGLGLLYLFEEYTDLILIDAIDTGTARPGEVFFFCLDELTALGSDQKLSAHQSGLLELLHLTKVLGKLPPKIKIIGIQVGEICFENRLSEGLQCKFGEIERKVKEEICRYINNA